MGKEVLLASTRVKPEKIMASGYRFRHPDLEGALQHLLGR
jgi:NAD dependent epimerase/dehydratase family enzyme